MPRKTGEYSEMLSDRTRCKPSLDFYSTLTAWSNISQREINKKSSRFIIPSPLDFPSPPVLSDLLVRGSFRKTTRLTFRRAFPVQVSEELGEPSNRTRGLERWPHLDQRPHKKYAYIFPQSTLDKSTKGLSEAAPWRHQWALGARHGRIFMGSHTNRARSSAQAPLARQAGRTLSSKNILDKKTTLSNQCLGQRNSLTKDQAWKTNAKMLKRWLYPFLQWITCIASQTIRNLQSVGGASKD